MNTIRASELRRRTGATYRQIDHWCSVHIISPVGDHCPGSGFPREFTVDTIAKVRFLVQVSKAFDFNKRSILKQLSDRFEEGYADLGDGIRLTWLKDGEVYAKK